MVDWKIEHWYNERYLINVDSLKKNVELENIEIKCRIRQIFIVFIVTPRPVSGSAKRNSYTRRLKMFGQNIIKIILCNVYFIFFVKKKKNSDNALISNRTFWRFTSDFRYHII